MKKTYIWIAIIILIVALFVFFISRRSAEPPFNEEIALGVLRPGLFADCLSGGMPDTYRSCKVEIFEEASLPGWRVWLTYDGLYDDSVQATRLEAYMVYRDGRWVVDSTYQAIKCAAGRGHQEFSPESCV